MTTERFDLDANTLGDAAHYLVNRSAQLLPAGMELRLMRPVYLDGDGVAMMAVYKELKTQKTFKAFYVLNSVRGKGIYQRLLKKYPGDAIVTTPDCHMKEFLTAKSIPHKLVAEFQLNPHYKWIQEVYGNTRAKRSGCYYMEHIDEGLAVLKIIGGSNRHYTREAWCLHPILQVDALRREHAGRLMHSITIDPYSVMLATEYRNIANAYLNPMESRKAEDIQLSSMAAVNAMLVADKVQNRKQFDLHRDKFHNADVLDTYFRTWLERLEVSEERYEELADTITVMAGIPTDIRSRRWAKENHGAAQVG